MLKKSVLAVHNHCIQVRHKTVLTQEFILPFYLYVHRLETSLWRHSAVFQDKSSNWQACS